MTETRLSSESACHLALQDVEEGLRQRVVTGQEPKIIGYTVECRKVGMESQLEDLNEQ